MTVDLDRTVSRLGRNGDWSGPAPLSTYRYAPAYVLLGDPGAGKSTALEREQSATPRAELVTARDFRTIYGDALSPQTETLFIDGLDEARAGGDDPRGPFDEIRIRLKQLTPKRVRISCRELDWLGESDRVNLSKVVPGGEVIGLRLEPLNADEQRLIIGADPRIADPTTFLIEATDRGVESLLTNAQTLSLLVRVVAENGAFPQGRTETFDEACLLLAQEPNDEHRIAAPLPEPEALVEAAGHMCAVSLLAGSVGFSLPNARETDGFVPTSRFGASAATAERAAHTRLFTSIGRGRFLPVHANIAAFLAAQHLARLADGSVPAGRILALLSGNDGFPPTPLRSLVAWLAALSSVLRNTLIERDPVAVLMYGDVREFTPNEKTLILDQIGRNPDGLYEGWWSASAVAGLATKDMESSLRRVLGDPDRTESKQKVVEVTVTALRHAEVRAGLSDELLGACRDETLWFPVRLAALDAWIESLRHERDRAHRLRALLDETLHGHTADPEKELLGTLLEALYPGDLEPSEVWHFLAPQSHLVINRFHRFWSQLPETCSPAHLASHLDHLAGEIPSLRGQLHDLFLDDLPVQLLARGLEVHGEQLDAPRLYKWLQVGLNEWGQAQLERGDPASMCRVRDWLEERPALQKAVIRAALRTDEFRKLDLVEPELNQRLYGSTLPDDIGTWHFNEAVAAADANLERKHLDGFVRALGSRPVAVDATLEAARRRLTDRPEALRYLESLLYWHLPSGHLERIRRWEDLPKSSGQPDQGLLAAAQPEREKLLANRAPPGLLHSLAQKYYEERMVLRPSMGRQHLLEALGGDESLTNAAQTAICRTIEREDLPSAEDLVQLRKRDRMSFFIWPILIGLEDRPMDEIMALGETRLRVALACRLLQLGLAQEAAWYRQCVRDRPDLVAEVLILVGRTLLAARETSFPDLYQLDHDEQLAPVARRALLPLLSAFPARARSAQLPLLDALLRGALHQFRTEQEVASLRATIERKAGQPSTTRLVRVRWLAAGLILDPDQFLPRLDRELSGSSLRRRSFGQFFEGFAPRPPEWLTNRLTSASLEFLVRTLGKDHNPIGPEPRFGVEIALLLPSLITQLSRLTDRHASESLDRLVEQEGLSRWRPMLDYSRDQQRVLRRDSQHKPPLPTEVIATLHDGPPASAADLRELVLDRLRRIAREVRSTNADLWQFFWNQDSHGKLTEPKPENPCRDALLEILSRRLPDGYDVQREGQYAANRRADLRIASGKWNIPVEIKKNTHSDLWGAVRNQLLPLYTNDPATEGLGIYLVLWFGLQRTAPVSERPRPGTAGELKDRLLASLDPEERRRAAVVVMDVTRPPAG